MNKPTPRESLELLTRLVNDGDVMACCGLAVTDMAREALAVLESLIAEPATLNFDASACYCSDYLSSGHPCPPGKCPNVPKAAEPVAVEGVESVAQFLDKLEAHLVTGLVYADMSPAPPCLNRFYCDDIVEADRAAITQAATKAAERGLLKRIMARAAELPGREYPIRAAFAEIRKEVLNG